MPIASAYTPVSRLVPPSPVWPGRAFSLQPPWGAQAHLALLETGMQSRFQRQPHISICHILAFRHGVTACLSPSCNLAVFTEALECESCGHTHGEHKSSESRTRVC